MAEELSKSAKRRAAKKARDAAFDEEAAAPPPAPEPKAKAKAKAAAAEPKAKAAAEPKGKEPEPKSKAKAKAKAAPEPEPKKEAAKPKAKAAAEPKAAAKAKASAAKAPPQEEEVKREELVQPFVIDDGTGGEWEQSLGVSKKAQKQKEKAEASKAMQAAAKQGKIPGMAAPNSIPGMAPAAVQRATQAEINAVLQRAQAAGTAARQAVEAEQAATAGATSNLHSASVKVPDNRIGVVIGPKGKNIQMIQEKTGVTRIDTSGEVFTIMGEAKAVEQAEAAVKELIEKGYWSQQFEDFKEEFVAVHPSVFPDLIGKGGVIIKAMKTEFGVEVSIPEVPKNAPAGKKFKVTLAGKKDNVEAAKEAINNIAMYGYDEHTHPGQTHEELDVPDWAYRFLIGKAGSELRHIQNNYKVKVNIPREHSACQAVVCVGEKINVERAKAYIDKLLWAAENQTKGREKGDAAEDHWGQEDAEEDWMKAYMYKRS
eukprot:TRINITY_DN500_c0_g1_i2.p1 TRINITY_DN500_c0_g1~~TRINITY_DN500_c0_g1_i2.p1  ORF type:complete len:511 (+),score=180.38 TRINITY_DN500_c0_g1_i2:84-1535(+)